MTRIKHKPIKVGYDLELFEKYNQRVPLYVDAEKSPHGTICGSSGSGKSYLTLMLLRNLLVEYQNDIKLWFMDFKNSSDFSFMNEYAHYYAGVDCAEGLENFYQEYLQVKDGSIIDGKLRIMIFDEWAGFQIWQTHQNKKLAEQYKGYLLEILLMGRSMLCGAWVIMQRNDAKFIEGREQMFFTIVLGKMSKELKQMILQGEELEQRDVYSCGEGIIRMDSIGTKFIKVPKLRDTDLVKQQILSCLTQADTAEGGDGEAC